MAKRKPVWVLIPAKSLRKIGVLKQSQQEPPSRTGETSHQLSNQPLQFLEGSVDEQQDGNGVGGDTPGSVEAEDTSIDRSSIAHCEVERRRKKKIATSIIQLTKLLKLKEIDPNKLAKADILRLTVDKIKNLKEANLELEKVISGSSHLEESEACSRPSLNDKLEELLLEHVSLKKQLQSKVMGNDKGKSLSGGSQEDKDDDNMASDPAEQEIGHVGQDLVAMESAESPVLNLEKNEDGGLEERLSRNSDDLPLDGVPNLNLESKGQECQNEEFCDGVKEVPCLSSNECCGVPLRTTREVTSLATDPGSVMRSSRAPSESSDVESSICCLPATPEVHTENSPSSVYKNKQDFSSGTPSYISGMTEEPTPRTGKNQGDLCSRNGSLSPGQRVEQRSSDGQLDQLASAAASVEIVEEPATTDNGNQSPSTSPRRLGDAGSVCMAVAAPILAPPPLPSAGGMASDAEVVETSAGESQHCRAPETTLEDSEGELGSAVTGDFVVGNCSRNSSPDNADSFSALQACASTDSNSLEQHLEDVGTLHPSPIGTLTSVSEPASKLLSVSSQQAGLPCPATTVLLTSAAPSITESQSFQSHSSSGSTGLLPQAEASLQPWPVSSLLSDSSVSVPMLPTDNCSNSSHADSGVPVLTSSTSVSPDNSTRNRGISSSSGPSGTIPNCGSTTSYTVCSNLPSFIPSSSSRSNDVSVFINSAIVSSACLTRPEHQVACRKPGWNSVGHGAGSSRSRRRRSREVDSEGVVASSKVRRTTAEVSASQSHLSQLRFPHPCGHHLPASSDGSRQFYANLPANVGGSLRPEQMSECSAPFSSNSLGLDFRHCRTFTNATSTCDPPAPPTPARLQQFPGGVSHLGSQCHQESSSAIVQPWVDHTHNQQVRSSQFSRQQQHRNSLHSRRMADKDSRERANGRLEYNGRLWRDNGQSQSFPLASQHSAAPPPPSLPLPPQNLDPHHHVHGGPFFQSHDYDPWFLVAGDKSRGHYYGGRDQAVRENWNSRSSPTYPQQHQPLNDARQWEPFVGLQRCCPGSFHEQEMPCDTMTPSSFPGVWRPYSETGTPQRGGGYGISSGGGSLGQSLPPPPPPPLPPPLPHRCPCGNHSTAVSPRHCSIQAGHTTASPSPYTRATPPSQPTGSLHIGTASHPHLEQPGSQFLQLGSIPAGNAQQDSHRNEPSRQEEEQQQHTLQMVPTQQPTSRTESFFVDRLLHDIG